MWLSDRRGFLSGLGALVAAGCTFQPAYGPGSTGASLRGALRADDPATRADRDFLIALETQLGRPVAPRYALSYDITVRDRGIEFRELRAGRVEYVLTDIATGAVRAQGHVTAEAAYSTTSTPLASLTATEDAETRLMRMLADRLVARLLATPGIAG
jgi:LPS-assembly lipoprotein